MNLAQNERINQVEESSIVIGIDIASEIHYARAFDWRGMELGKVLQFENNLKGFEKLHQWIEQLQQEHQKDSVLLGAEPTGHYWFNLADDAKDKDLTLVLVNPFHVKRSKELDDNHPGKSDRKDPKTIAKLVIQGRYMTPYIPEGIYADLRIAMNSRQRIVQEVNGIKNRMERWLSIYFPEYKEVFASPYGMGSLEILKTCPLPQEILELGEEKINQLWRSKRIKAVGSKRAGRLYETAKRSIGRKEGSQMAKMELEMLLEDYEQKHQQLTALLQTIEELCQDIPAINQILAIKGIGLISIAGIFAEIGDISRFDSPKQIQKLAGLAIGENSSGKHKGKTSITKRGRKRLRAVLFQVILPLVANNQEFRELHRYYTTREHNPLKKKQSLIALCCKLIRILYGISTKGFTYDGDKMLSEIKREIPMAA